MALRRAAARALVLAKEAPVESRVYAVRSSRAVQCAAELGRDTWPRQARQASLCAGHAHHAGRRALSSAAGSETADGDAPDAPPVTEVVSDGAAEAASATSAATPPEPAVKAETTERHTFEAETGQLLQIVAHSLYTDKHVFIRELVSNASDALEKARHLQVTGATLADADAPLEIRITTDEAAGTFTIEDTGIGLSRDELVKNLGMIARSGSKAFLQEALEKGAGGSSLESGLIGQFGVGFYSAFMVSDDVRVFSQSAESEKPAHMWKSAGDGSYEICEAEGVSRGTRIVVSLRDASREFANAKAVKDIIKKYSNFVQYPIFVNGEQVNTVKAVWALNPSEVTEEEYDGFYRHISHQFDSPMYRLHFTSDAPISLKALFYVGQQHMEKFNMGVQKPGVHLYSRKVLIEAESGVMPLWLRFVHGVVDSEDIPLNISRESMQDSALIQRIRNVLTRRFIRFLEQKAKKEPEQYLVFFREFGRFLKEGVCSDRSLAPEIAKLLRYESTGLPAGEMTSLDEYISRMEPTQKSIYYIVANNRQLAEASPYMEAFRAAGGNTEVLLLYDGVDDFVMSNLHEYNGRKLVTAEAGSIDLATDGASSKAEDSDASTEDSPDSSSARLSEDDVQELGEWLMNVALPEKLSKVTASNRLTSTPAVITDHESAAVRRMMRFVEQAQSQADGTGASEPMALPKQQLEVNPKHPIIVNLFAARGVDVELARSVAEQIYDNALLAAGLLDDSRVMLPRLNQILTRVMESPAGGAGGKEADAAEES